MSLLDTVRKIRRDGWYNTLTGLGDALRDKSQSTAFYSSGTLSDIELDALFNDSDLAETIVSAVVDDALRQGIEIESEESEDDEREAEIGKRCDALDVVGSLAMAATMGRLFGGAAIYPVLDDGAEPQEPLDVERVREVYSLLVLDRRQLQPVSWYVDPASGKIGQVEAYQLQITSGSTYGSPIVHESRLVMFGGLRTTRTRKQHLGGWDRSALQPAYDVLRKTGASFDGAMQLMSDMSQAVWKIKGLIEMFGADQEEAVRTRMAATELGRSSFRAIMLDAEGEDFERVATPMTGIDVMLDRSWQRLAAAARMPVTRLMGVSPAGLNATGESDTRNWYDQVKAFQSMELAPRANRLVQLVARSLGEQEPERFTACFPSLWQMTPKEQAELEKLAAEKDAIYITAAVLLPEEVALSRYGDGNFSASTKIDTELRQSMAAPDPEPQPKLAPPVVEPPAPEPKVDHVDAIAKLTAAAADARRAGLEIDISAQLAEHGAPVTGKVE